MDFTFLFLKLQFFTISESVAYHWGPKPGLIRYYFLEGSRPNTKSDVLSLGFITPLENAIMLRIDSDSSSDFIEVEIVSNFVQHFTSRAIDWKFLSCFLIVGWWLSLCKLQFRNTRYYNW